MQFDKPEFDGINHKVEEKVPEIKTDIWEKDEVATAAMHDLATAEFLKCKEGVEVLFLKTNLLRDPTSTPYLVTRVEQRAVVEHAIKLSRDSLDTVRHTVALRGSPGIGKSWSSLLYIRILMNKPTQERRPILFERGENPKKRELYMLAPSGSIPETWDVFRLRAEQSLPREWEDCSMIDIVIDPAQFSKGEEPVASPLIITFGHKFIPVSPDDRHLGSELKMSGWLLELVLGPWKLKELLVAFPYMIFGNPQSVYEDDQKTFNNKMTKMVHLYYKLGGLPRYLQDNQKARARLDQLTPAYANENSDALLSALAEGPGFSDQSQEKILTRFLTLRPGEDEDGYNPSREYATVDFVSPGAAKAAGKIILRKIHHDVTWRGANDASDIGLAYERAVLIFLSLGDVGMEKIGIRTRCRRLVASRAAGAKREIDTSDEEVVNVLLSLEAESSGEKMMESPDATSFERTVRENGCGMEFVDDNDDDNDGLPTLWSDKPLVLPPDGYCNFDAMAGADLGINATLQKTHSVSGPEYIRQRQAYGLVDGDPFALVFVVPPERFENGWTTIQQFHWQKETGEATTSRKRRRVAGNKGAVSLNADQIKERDKAKARSSIQQYVLTLEVDE